MRIVITECDHDSFDAEREARMLNDFQQVRDILAQWDVPMHLDKPFWRTIGKVPDSVP